MGRENDELGEALKRIAFAAEQRGHAPWFNANNEFQSAMETFAVGE